MEAGVGLAISKTMLTVGDWALLGNPKVLVLATPALVAGFVLTWTSRKIRNDAALPLAMVAMPGLFYIVIFVSGVGMQGARDAGWIGGM